jgi:hypothetical protein
MKLSGHVSSIFTAIAAAATSLAADRTLPDSWHTVAQTVVIVLAALLTPTRKP